MPSTHKSPIFPCLLFAAVLSWAQSTPQEQLAALNAEAVKLYQSGKYREGTEVALRALAMAEKALGPEHPDTGTSMNNLAVLYQAQGQYAKAEPLYMRAGHPRESAGAGAPRHWHVGE